MEDIDETHALRAEKAQEILKPHLEHLSQCVKDAWLEWKSITTRYPSLSARSRASVVNDFIWEGVKRYAEHTSGVTAFEGSLRLLCIENHVTIRFKKLDRLFRARSILTHQQVRFINQEPIPGIPPLVRLTMGYILSPLQDSIKSIAVTLQRRDSLAWTFVVPSTQPTGMIVSPFVQSDLVTPRVRKVRVKQQNQDSHEPTGNDI